MSESRCRTQKLKNILFRMNSFMKELCERKCYTKTTKKLEFEVEKAILEKFVRYVTEKKSKPKFSGLSFEVVNFCLRCSMQYFR